MIIKTIKLSSNEQYACTEKDIKRVFLNDEILFVSFGYLAKTFEFDSSAKKRPKIHGLIISSCSINQRMNLPDKNIYLSFFVIRDPHYEIYGKECFINSVLPKIHDWYSQTKSAARELTPGIDQLIVEWTGATFKLHQLKYM
jgi:hypothetical protein